MQDGRCLLISVSASDDVLNIDEVGPSPLQAGAWHMIRSVQSNVSIGGSGPVSQAAIDTSGRFLSAIGSQVLSFNLRRLAQGSALQELASTSRIAARGLAYCGATAGALLVRTEDNRIFPLDAHSGIPLERPQAGSSKDIVAMACAPAESLLVVAELEGRVRLIHTRTGNEVNSFKAGDRIASLAVTRWEGRTVGLLGVRLGVRWAARLWDLESCTEIDSHGRYTLSHGEEDKLMRCVGAAEVDGALRIAFASTYAKIMVADFTRGATPSWPFAFQEWHMRCGHDEDITCIAIGHHGTDFWVAAGTQYGHLKVWDFRSGETVATREHAHHQHAITALSFHSSGRDPMLISGGADNVLRCWTVRLERKLSIDVGVAIRAIAWIGAQVLAVATQRGVLAVSMEKLL
jgi:WD40 repeat protein